MQKKTIAMVVALGLGAYLLSRKAKAFIPPISEKPKIEDPIFRIPEQPFTPLPIIVEPIEPEPIEPIFNFGGLNNQFSNLFQAYKKASYEGKEEYGSRISRYADQFIEEYNNLITQGATKNQIYQAVLNSYPLDAMTSYRTEDGRNQIQIWGLFNSAIGARNPF